jgi:hypothetical protein
VEDGWHCVGECQAPEMVARRRQVAQQFVDKLRKVEGLPPDLRWAIEMLWHVGADGNLVRWEELEWEHKGGTYQQQAAAVPGSGSRRVATAGRLCMERPSDLRQGGLVNKEWEQVMKEYKLEQHQVKQVMACVKDCVEGMWVGLWEVRNGLVHGGGQSEAVLAAKRRMLRDGMQMMEQRGVSSDPTVTEASSFKQLKRWLRGESGKLGEHEKQGVRKLHTMWGQPRPYTNIRRRRQWQPKPGPKLVQAVLEDQLRPADREYEREEVHNSAPWLGGRRGQVVPNDSLGETLALGGEETAKGSVAGDGAGDVASCRVSTVAGTAGGVTAAHASVMAQGVEGVNVAESSAEAAESSRVSGAVGHQPELSGNPSHYMFDPG